MYDVIAGNLTTALNLEILELYGVNHILTVDSVPLPRSATDIAYMTAKFIQGEKKILDI